MFLLDLISSVNHALPRLVAAATEASDDEPSFGPRIRCAFLQRTNEVAPLHASWFAQGWSRRNTGPAKLEAWHSIAASAYATIPLSHIVSRGRTKSFAANSSKRRSA